MRHLPVTEKNAELVESLKQFLNAQSVAAPAIRYCSECGSLLSYLSMQFWLQGNEQGWNIRLPYCPQCHPVPAAKRTLVA